MEMKPYVFQVELVEEEDGRWSALIPNLPGCSAWGYTCEESLNAVQYTARAYIEVLIEDGDPLPKETTEAASVIEGSKVVVTVQHSTVTVLE